jgi:hypothetical protein
VEGIAPPHRRGVRVTVKVKVRVKGKGKVVTREIEKARNGRRVRDNAPYRGLLADGRADYP